MGSWGIGETVRKENSERPLKILLATEWYHPLINGVVISVRNLSRALQERGHDVRIMTLSPRFFPLKKDNIYYIGSIKADRLYPGGRASFPAYFPHYEELTVWAPDVVHTHAEFTTFFLARRLAATHNIPRIHTYHTMYEDYTHYFTSRHEMGKRTIEFLSRRLLHDVDRLIAPTEKVEKLLLGYGINTPIEVVPTGIDLQRFAQSPGEAQVREIRKKWGITEDNKVLLYVGRMAKEKNLEELIDYFSKVKEENWRLLLVGDGPYRKELIELVERKRLKQWVQFTGMIPPEDVAPYYHVGHVFVNNSISETQGLTYIEALASGLPCVCRIDPLLSEWMIDGVTGYGYDDLEGFSQGLRFVFQSEEFRKTLSSHAKSISDRYSIESFGEKMERIYRDVITEHPLNQKSAARFPGPLYGKLPSLSGFNRSRSEDTINDNGETK